MSTPLPDAEDLLRALVRKFLTAQVDGPGSPLAAGFPVAAAEVAMSVIGPVLEERDAEIARLSAQSAPERACCCDHEGWYDSRCACCNRKAAAEAVENGSEEGRP